MLNPAHVLETAFLLLAAFLIGATVGSLAKLLVLRMRPTSKAAAVATVPAAAATVAEQPALVAAPVIEPTAKPAQPAAPLEVPTPDFSEVANAIAAEKAVAPAPESEAPKVRLVDVGDGAAQMAPAREAGKTTSGKQVQSPQAKDEVVAPAAATGPGADVIPFPVERTAPVAEASPAKDVAEEPEATTVDVPLEPAAAVEEVSTPEAQDTAETVEATSAPVAGPEPAGDGVAVDQPAAEVAAPPVAEEPKAHDKPAALSEDETAAMRAIEGTWTPRRSASRSAAKVPAPERIATDDSGTVDAPISVEPPGRPAGLAAPRDGLKDSLTNVIGILPVIETSLNSIGIFHYDQVGEFSDENVSWLEAHLGIGGRIDREHWREQARELAAMSDNAGRVAGQQ